MSASDALTSEVEEQEAWPAFVDLFSATSLLFIAFVGIFIYLLALQRTGTETNRQAILRELQARSEGGGLFQVDSTEKQFVRIILTERATFPLGQYRWESLRDSGKVALNSIGSVLRDPALGALYREVRVLGHTDQYPIRSPDLSNWELSASRAAVVARYLVDQSGVDPCKVSATGMGPYHPVGEMSATDVPRMAEANRRIEIQIIPGLLGGGESTEWCYQAGDRAAARSTPRLSPAAQGLTAPPPLPLDGVATPATTATPMESSP